jgi:hypothetical protein
MGLLAQYFDGVNVVGGRGDRGCTFNCGIIFIDEMTLYQLDCQARLSNSTTAHNNELILSQKL